MLLIDFLDTYADYRNLKPRTLESYGYVLKRFDKHLKREATLEDLRDETVNRWLRALMKSHSQDTIHSSRCTILSLWNLASKLGKCEPPTLIRNTHPSNSPVQSLSSDRIQKLIEATATLKGKYNGYRRADYYRTLIRGFLETALRAGDIHSIEWRDAQSAMTIIQEKNGIRNRVRFSRELLEDMRSWHSTTGLCWPAGCVKTSNRVITALSESIGIGTVTTTDLRKTSITNVERQQPGTGWLHAGHASPETTRRWYTDWHQVKAPKPDFFCESSPRKQGET